MYDAIELPYFITVVLHGTIKTSRVTINNEMHEQVHTINKLLPRCFSIAISVLHSLTYICIRH